MITILLRRQIPLAASPMRDRPRPEPGPGAGGPGALASGKGSRLGTPRILLTLLLAASTLSACAGAPPHPKLVPLSGTRNTRDLGGYSTAEGGRVKSGLIYRSDELSDLNRRDRETVGGLGLQRIYDLRTDSEREAKPDRLPEDDPPRLVVLPLHFEELTKEVLKPAILKGTQTERDSVDVMLRANRAYALEEIDLVGTLLRGLAEPGALPALFHCRDGKDRTGFLAAVILRALGVPQETVIEDYLLSNEFLEDRIRHRSRLAYFGSWFRTKPREVLPLLEVRRDYLEAAFAAIEERYGSFEAYLLEGLELDDITLQRLRKALLE